jgi:hypothetical protein
VICVKVFKDEHVIFGANRFVLALITLSAMLCDSLMLEEALFLPVHSATLHALSTTASEQRVVRLYGVP